MWLVKQGTSLAEDKVAASETHAKILLLGNGADSALFVSTSILPLTTGVVLLSQGHCLSQSS